MKKYFNYLIYLLEHKKNVFIECWKEGLYIHAFLHDLSKFLPSEFIPYAKFFMAKNRAKEYKKSDEDNSDFQKGWLKHQKRNKHHWNYWVSITRKNEIIPIPMPLKYVKQMICDWKGMSRKFGGSWQEYYEKNKEDFILHPITEETIGIIIKNERNGKDISN